MESATFSLLNQTLFPTSEEGGDSAYAVLDCAKDPQIFPLIMQSGLFHGCLFAGEMSPSMESAAPHVVKLAPGHPFLATLFEKGWGQHWGIFVTAAKPAGIEDVRRHLRKFLMVTTPDKRKLFFRYFDPRVLRAYLPTCIAEECDMLFKPIVRYICEAPESDQVMLFDRERILEVD